MITVMNFMIKALALKERIFGSKSAPQSPEARAVASVIRLGNNMMFKDNFDLNEGLAVLS